MVYNPREFVNRKAELKALTSLLNDHSRRILLLSGDTGVGKTWVLHRLRRVCLEAQTLSPLVDFRYDSTLFTPDRVIRRLREQIGGAFAEQLAQVESQILRDPALNPTVMLSQPGQALGGAFSSLSSGAAGGVSIAGSVEVGGDIVGRDKITISNSSIIVNPGGGLDQAQTEIRTRRNTTFRAALSQLLAERSLVVFFDHFEEATDEVVHWLRRQVIGLHFTGADSFSNLWLVVAGLNQPFHSERHHWGHVFQTRRIEPLEYEAIQMFWVDKRGLDPANLSQVARLSGGNPRSLFFMANNAGEYSAGRQPASPDSETSLPTFDDGLQFLENWLPRSTSVVAAAARYAALPRSFDLTLLSILRGTREGTASLVEQFKQAGFVEAKGSGWYALLPSLRSSLLRRWQAEDRQTYRRLSARAAVFYQSRLTGDEADRINYVYHQLGAGDERGLEALSEAFERAWSARDFGFIEQLLAYAAEQKPILGPGGEVWLRYFRVRLDLVHNRYEQSEPALRSLLAEAPDPALKAQILTSLANVLSETGRWSDAFDYYAEALDLFLGLREGLKASRVFEARGMAYIRLVSSLGGLPEHAIITEPTHLAWLRRLRHAPFRLYRWLSRRLSFLPNLYFGTDYQDWLIIRLLYEAIGQFEAAAEQLARLPSETDRSIDDLDADIQIRLADLYHRVGQWALAERLFEHLIDTPAVKTSEYRRAMLCLGQGRAALTRSRLEIAQAHLRAACQVFTQIGDRRAIAVTARLLGDTKVALGDLEAAVSHYADSIAAALATDDLLVATRVWSTLTTIDQAFNLSPPAQSQLKMLEPKLDRRAYIARFSGTLLGHFRKLAVYVITPLTYLLGPVLALQLTVLAANQPGYQEMPTSYNYIFLAIPILTIWLYEFLYVCAGWFFIRLLPLKDLARRQPEYVVTTPEGIAVRDTQGRLQEISWELHDGRSQTIKGYMTVNRALWRTPIALFSRLVLVSDSTALVLDGIISHYQHLQGDIARHLKKIKGAVAEKRLEFSLLDSRWTLVALGLTILFTIIDLSGSLDPDQERNIIKVTLADGSRRDLLLASLLYIFSLWAFNFFPLIALGRLLYNRLLARRALSSRISLGADWPIWLAFILLLLWTLVWIRGLWA